MTDSMHTCIYSTVMLGVLLYTSEDDWHTIDDGLVNG